jgi:hypothetical protein
MVTNRYLVLVVLAAVAAGAGDAEARRNRSLGGQKYVANGTFGLGLELGSPSGLNGKYFLSDTTALNFGLGVIYDRYYYDDRDGIHLYLDHLWHPLSLANKPAVQIPLYIGVGVRLWDFDDNRRGFDDDGFALGVRMPLGLAFDFNRVPIDMYIQLTFAVDTFFAYYRDERLGFHIEGSIGFRYWFK